MRPVAGQEEEMDKSAACRQEARELMQRFPTVQGWALMSRDGIVMLAQLPPGVDEDLLGTLGAALISLSDRWAESRSACATEYILLGDCRYRHLFLPAGGEGILALFLDVKGDWNSVVAASCMLAERMGQVLELA